MKKIISLCLAMILCLTLTTASYAWTEGEFFSESQYSGWYTYRNGNNYYQSNWGCYVILYDSVGSYADMYFGYMHSASSPKDYVFTRMTYVPTDKSSAAIQRVGYSNWNHTSWMISGEWASLILTHYTSNVNYCIAWQGNHQYDLYAYVTVV